MIKRIVFDVDDTLIINKEEFIKYYESLFKENKKENALKLNDIINDYDNVETIYSKEKMLEFINKKMNTNYDISFVENLIDIVGKYWINNIDKSIFEYLSSKYELYALTNWFTKAQKNRLKNSGIYDYFIKVIGADTVKMKPNKEAFITASKGTDITECLFIGDNPVKDLDVPYSMGARVIFINTKNKYTCNYETINNLKELTEIL